MNEINNYVEEQINAIDINGPEPVEEPYRQYYFMAKARKYVSELSKKLGRPLTATCNTFGCQMLSYVTT